MVAHRTGLDRKTVRTVIASGRCACIDLVIVPLPETTRDFVLPPKRDIAERSLAWTIRFRRLVWDLNATPARWPNCTSSLSFALC